MTVSILSLFLFSLSPSPTLSYNHMSAAVKKIFANIYTTYTHIYIFTHLHTHAYLYTLSNTHTHIHSHTHSDTHSHTHTHSDTHSHTPWWCPLAAEWRLEWAPWLVDPRQQFWHHSFPPLLPYEQSQKQRRDQGPLMLYNVSNLSTSKGLWQCHSNLGKLWDFFFLRAAHRVAIKQCANTECSINQP